MLIEKKKDVNKAYGSDGKKIRFRFGGWDIYKKFNCKIPV